MREYFPSDISMGMWNRGNGATFFTILNKDARIFQGNKEQQGRKMLDVLLAIAVEQEQEIKNLHARLDQLSQPTVVEAAQPEITIAEPVLPEAQDELANKSITELKKLATELGIKPVGTKKSELIDAITVALEADTTETTGADSPT